MYETEKNTSYAEWAYTKVDHLKSLPILAQEAYNKKSTYAQSSNIRLPVQGPCPAPSRLWSSELRNYTLRYDKS